MKETTIKLADVIVEFLHQEATELGMEVAELLRFIIGSYVQGEKQSRQSHSSHGVLMSLPTSILKNISSGFNDLIKQTLKERAREGALSCKDCTMKITEEDVENGKCGACGLPLREALGGESE